MLEEQFAVLHGLWGEPDGWSFEGKQVTDRGRAFHPSRWPARSAGRPNGAPAAAPRRGRGVAALASGSPPAMPTSSTCRSSSPGRRDAEVRGAGRGVRGDRARPGDDGAARRWSGVLIGRDDAEVARPGAGAARRRSASADDGGEAWFEAREPRWIIGHARQGAGDGRGGSRTAGVERIMLQDFMPRDLEMIDLDGRGAVRLRPDGRRQAVLAGGSAARR